MRLRGKRRLALLVAGGVLVTALMIRFVAPLVTTTVFLLDMADVEPAWRRWIPAGGYEVLREDRIVTTRHGTVPVRIYRPEGVPSRAAVVFPGVHGGGVDEPRLVELCQRLAATGTTVVCAPLPELREFIITARSTDQIEDITGWAVDEPAVGATRRVALVGVSFAGGLTLVAAGRPALANRIDVVVSIGGYGDLPRVLRYLCTGLLPDGSWREPHDYGLAVVAYAATARLVPAEQAPGLARGIRTFLEASLGDRPGHRPAGLLLEDARRQATELPEPAGRILQAIIERDRARIGALLEPLVDELGDDPALSPERSPATETPVFLLHGSEDNVIPSAETPLVGRYLRAQENEHVEWLLTPLIRHAELRSVTGLADGWRLIGFWRRVFAAVD
jgi:acetyl esterase/lipase